MGARHERAKRVERPEDGSKTNGKDADKWPIPHPLPDSLMPVAAFDLELIPDQLLGR